MNKPLFCSLFLLIAFFLNAQTKSSYQSLDPKNPITFTGKTISYQGKTITLGPKAFFIDTQFSKEQLSKYPYIFNSINDAVKQLSNGTETAPMSLYIAPNVYWVDNPDDPKIRKPEGNGTIPYALNIKCDWLRFYGLTNNPENVVIAANRGQTIGAVGNFTLFKISGEGTNAENVTFGNYCNVDLNFPLKPELNRSKRATAIVQAQLIHCDGDKILARNCRFISRLNLCPFTGGKRVLFDRCHFESTDDALCGTAVYLNSTLDFYSSKPFYWTKGTGAAFLNCKIHSFTNGNQFFTKANGQLAVIDTKFTAENPIYLGWNDNLPLTTRNYQYLVSLNNNPVLIENKNPESTIDMSNLEVLNAYQFNFKGKTIYNTYNLLAGNDDWDPMNIKNIVLTAEKEQGKKLRFLPTQLLIETSQKTLETKKDKALLKASAFRFGNYEVQSEKINWSVAAQDKAIVELKPSANSNECEIIPNLLDGDSRNVIITAKTASGLEAAVVIKISPPKLESPVFTEAPHFSKINNGILNVQYKVNTDFKDQTIINYYRCTDNKGGNPIEIAVSRDNIPLTEYPLTIADLSYYIMATLAPKNNRSDAGKTIKIVTQKAISAKEITANKNTLITDFKNSSTKDQLEIIPGFWTFSPFDKENINNSNPKDAWYFGEGFDGAANQFGLLPTGRSARLLYTPVKRNYTDMTFNLQATPFKTAGQGFSVAHMYMDILIKWDAKTDSGYALRFIRTTKHHDAVDCILLEYQNGISYEISKAVTTHAFNGRCNISLEVKNNHLTATLSNKPTDSLTANNQQETILSALIKPSIWGGFGIFYNGGSQTMINEIQTSWK